MDYTYFAGKSLYGLGNGLGGLVIMSAPVPCQPARGKGPFLSLCLSVSVSACAHSLGLSLPVSIYTQKKRGPLCWVASLVVCLLGWCLVSPIRTGTQQAGRAFCHISVYLGRWFQSCGPLGLRYSRGSRGLWPRCGSYKNTALRCVSWFRGF